MAALVVSLGVSSCRSPGANVWNLEQVHTPDGRPNRRGTLRSPIEQMLRDLAAAEDIADLRLTAEQTDQRIENPLEVCLRNLNALSRSSRHDPYDRALVIQMVTWLSGDCTYVLSRERCALDIGTLGRWYGVQEPRYPESPQVVGTPPAAGDGPAPADVPQAASAEELAPLIGALIGASQRAALAGSPGPDLETACTALRDVAIDRAGARRLVAVTALILRKYGFDTPELAAVRRLHDGLCRESLELALGVLLRDPDPVPRAAAVRSWITLTRKPSADGTPPDSGAARDALAAGFVDPDPLVVLESVRSLEQHGVPTNVEEPEAAARGIPLDRLWMSRLVALLGRLPEGPLHVSICNALSRISGEGRNLHPEYWIAKWNAMQREGAGGDAVRDGADGAGAERGTSTGSGRS